MLSGTFASWPLFVSILISELLWEFIATTCVQWLIPHSPGQYISHLLNLIQLHFTACERVDVVPSHILCDLKSKHVIVTSA